MGETTFEFRRSARSTYSISMTLVAVVFVCVLAFGIAAHPLIVLFFALVALPAIWDVLKNNEASLTIDETAISWQVGARHGSVVLSDIDRVKAVTSLDLSQRATIFLHDGGKRHIPAACMPGGRQFDAEIQNRDIEFRRSIF